MQHLQEHLLERYGYAKAFITIHIIFNEFLPLFFSLSTLCIDRRLVSRRGGRNVGGRIISAATLERCYTQGRWRTWALLPTTTEFEGNPGQHIPFTMDACGFHGVSIQQPLPGDTGIYNGRRTLQETLCKDAIESGRWGSTPSKGQGICAASLD